LQPLQGARHLQPRHGCQHPRFFWNGSSRRCRSQSSGSKPIAGANSLPRRFSSG
jgi:hypothetical protein